MLDYWTHPPIDAIIKIYMFNYTNANKVIDGVESRFRLQEIGPYVYRERIEKTGMSFDRDKITYYVRMSSYFVIF